MLLSIKLCSGYLLLSPILLRPTYQKHSPSLLNQTLQSISGFSCSSDPPAFLKFISLSFVRTAMGISFRPCSENLGNNPENSDSCLRPPGGHFNLTCHSGAWPGLEILDRRAKRKLSIRIPDIFCSVSLIANCSVESSFVVSRVYVGSAFFLYDSYKFAAATPTSATLIGVSLTSLIFLT